MNETVMKLSSDGRIVQIDNVSWSYYIDVDRARSLEDHKSGKWMHFLTTSPLPLRFAERQCWREL